MATMAALLSWLASLLLLDACADDAKSEVLHTKIFTLLLGERYRSHKDTLFTYRQGAWQMSPGGTLTAEDLEFLTMALRRAQAYFAHPIDRNQVTRDYDSVAWELKVILSMSTDEPLLEWQLGEFSAAKPEKRSRQWSLGCAELARDLRKALQDHSRSLVKSFLRWSDSPLDAKSYAGIAFADCYVSTAKGKIRQMKKDARRGCYMFVPAALAWTPPDHARQRLAALLVSAFAKTNGLSILLAQAALAVSRYRQPEVMHIVVGAGADGKSMVCVELMRACFGTAFANPACSVLQVEREWQQQAHAYFNAMMLTFDEVRREAGVQEDTLKVLIAGGLLPMRRNHEPETRYHSFEYCAKTWLMNSADIPSLPTALETSHSRRFLCTFMRNSLTHDGSQVDISQCRFLSDPDAKSFCASPAAVWTFYNDWLLPYMEANCPRSSQKLLTEIDPNSQTAKDTQWLLQRMARLTDTSSPDDAVAAPGASPHTAETLVREAHRSMTNTYLTTHAVNRFSFLHNPGVSTRTRNSTKRLRSEYLQEACQEWPHLLREVPGAAGRAAKFLRRSLDVDRMQEVITSVCAGHDAVTVADVFGAWDDWKWPEEQPGETSWDSLLQGDEPESFPWSESTWEIQCHLDLDKLKEYAEIGADARQDQLQQFVDAAERDGQRSRLGHTILPQVGQRKMVGSEPLGRHFFPHISLPALSRSARTAACPIGSLEFDQRTAIVNLMLQVAKDAGLLTPCLRKYSDHTQAWRQAVAEYHGLDLADAKTVLMKATFGFALPVGDAAAGTLPFLQGLAAESKLVRETLCRSHPHVLDEMVRAERQRPETSTMAFLLFHKEDAATRLLVSLLNEHGWILVCPIFDGVIAVPGPETVPGTEDAIVQEFEDQTNLRLSSKPVHS